MLYFWEHVIDRAGLGFINASSSVYVYVYDYVRFILIGRNLALYRYTV